EFRSKESERMTIDLSAVVKKQLLAQGIAADKIVTSAECTYCQAEKYYSYRRDKPENVQSMIAYVGLM
ncbi:MAG: laccase domain-containing protein, partial [Candidatus Komeilibacteria bacterium]|nr:laccase domain-containing protein [Candidatus Komeilibacteria bacterium]